MMTKSRFQGLQVLHYANGNLERVPNLEVEKFMMSEWYEFECLHVKIYLGWSYLESKVIYEKKWNVWARDFH